MAITNRGEAATGQELMAILYHEIRALARWRLSGERSNHTLNTTALANEVYLRLAQSEQRFESENEFIAAAANTMRRILVDHARARNCQKRGGPQDSLQLSSITFEISDDHTVRIEALDQALDELARIDARQARVVEMKFFGGLNMKEIALELGVSSKTVKRDWATSRSWLKAALTP